MTAQVTDRVTVSCRLEYTGDVKAVSEFLLSTLNRYRKQLSDANWRVG